MTGYFGSDYYASNWYASQYYRAGSAPPTGIIPWLLPALLMGPQEGTAAPAIHIFLCATQFIRPSYSLQVTRRPSISCEENVQPSITATVEINPC